MSNVRGVYWFRLFVFFLEAGEHCDISDMFCEVSSCPVNLRYQKSVLV